MRQIGIIDTDARAEAFSDYLLAQGMPNMVEEDAGGKWSVWVENDDHLDRARTELAAFTQSPDDLRYKKAGKIAGVVRKTDEKKQERLKKQFVNVRTRWSQPQQWNVPLTLTLIMLSVAVTIGTNRGKNEGPTELVRFGTKKTFDEGYYQLPVEDTRDLDVNNENDPPLTITQFLRDRWNEGRIGMRDILRGEVWRIVLPIFLHYSILHIVFNMMWLRDLGGMIERQRGTLFLGLLVLVSAVISNIAQDFWDGPFAGGMSGVVYALFGYAWMRGKFDPELGISVAPQTVILMLVWLVLCMTGALGPIGNAAHFVGLIVGVIFGYLPVLRRKWGKSAPPGFF